MFALVPPRLRLYLARRLGVARRRLAHGPGGGCMLCGAQPAATTAVDAAELRAHVRVILEHVAKLPPEWIDQADDHAVDAAVLALGAEQASRRQSWRKFDALLAGGAVPGFDPDDVDPE